MGAAARGPWLAEAVVAAGAVLPGRAFAVAAAAAAVVVVVVVVVAVAVEAVAGIGIVAAVGVV